MEKKFIKKCKNIGIASATGIVVTSLLTGCSGGESGGESTFAEASKQQGAFVIIQQMGEDSYKVVDQYANPTGETRAILRDLNGNEKLLSEEELKALAADEAKKVEEGSSRLTDPNSGDLSGGMSLGETILASAAGAIMGSMIGNMLFNNQNFKNKMKTNSSISRPAKPAPKASSTSSSKKSGFFGSSTNQKTSSFGG